MAVVTGLSRLLLCLMTFPKAPCVRLCLLKPQMDLVVILCYRNYTPARSDGRPDK